MAQDWMNPWPCTCFHGLSYTLIPGSDVDFSGYLLISGAVPSDSGRYTCVVSNTAGHDTAVANVLVTGTVTTSISFFIVKCSNTFDIERF